MITLQLQSGDNVENDNIIEREVIQLMNDYDWMSELGDNLARYKLSQLSLDTIESMIFKLWQCSPQRAITIWAENSIPAQQPSMVPSFIFRKLVEHGI